MSRERRAASRLADLPDETGQSDDGASAVIRPPLTVHLAP